MTEVGKTAGASGVRVAVVPAMEVPPWPGLIVAEAPVPVMAGGSTVETDFIPMYPQDLVLAAVELVRYPDIATVTIHYQDTPADLMVLAYTVGQRLHAVSPGVGVVVLGEEPEDPAATAAGRHVVAHAVHRYTGTAWRERTVWEVMSPRRHAAWAERAR